jgi:putative membrane protein
MIEYDAKDWYSIIFRLKGSVLPRLVPRVAIVAGVGALAAWLFDSKGTKIPPLAHTLIGVALGLLLVFRTNASYDRYWEGRRLLGAMVNRSRDLARQFSAWIEDEGTRDELRRRVAAFYVLAAQTLRKEDSLAKIKLLTEAERSTLQPVVSGRAPVMAGWITQALAREAKEGRLSETRLLLLDQNLTALVDALGGAERIVKTPIPFAYAQHIKTFVVLFCTTVPFAMAESMHWYTPVAAAVLAFALFGIDEIGVEIEDPFGYDPNDLPLDAIGEGIDKVTREILSTRE